MALSGLDEALDWYVADAGAAAVSKIGTSARRADISSFPRNALN